MVLGKFALRMGPLKKDPDKVRNEDNDRKMFQFKGTSSTGQGCVRPVQGAA